MNKVCYGYGTRERDQGHRQRSNAECMRDLLNACSHLGDIAVGCEIAGQPPDLADIERTTTGLQRVLIDLRAQGGEP